MMTLAMTLLHYVLDHDHTIAIAVVVAAVDDDDDDGSSTGIV